MTTNRVDFIEPKDFRKEVLEESAAAYLCHFIMIEGSLSQVHLSRMAQCLAATEGSVALPEAYKCFEDIFSIENGEYLAAHEDHNHAIDLVEGKKTPYKPIYSLSENELPILRVYIDKNFANRFSGPKNSQPVPIFCLLLSLTRAYGNVLTTVI